MIPYEILSYKYMHDDMYYCVLKLRYVTTLSKPPAYTCFKKLKAMKSEESA